MKRIVLTFGVISGLISSVLMLTTMPFMDRIGYDRGEIVGYTAMVLSFLLVFFGVRSYRDNVAGGNLTFGRGFTVGLLITLVSCVFYVATWQVVYFKLAPGFVDKYQAYLVERAEARGASEQEIAETKRQMAQFKEWYDNPFFNAAITFLEPLPVGLVVTLVSAGVLRRKPETPARV